MLSSSPSSLFPYISFFTSLLSSSFLTFFLNSYQISICCLPPGHHISGSCSRLGLASSHTHLPLSTSIYPSFLLIHSVFPANSSAAFSFIFSSCTLYLVYPIKPHPQVFETLYLFHLSLPLVAPTIMLALKLNFQYSPYSCPASAVLLETPPVTLYHQHTTVPHTNNSPAFTPRPSSSSFLIIPDGT